jgi:6-phosphogluconolactonase
MITVTVAGDEDAAARMTAQRVAEGIEQALAERGVAHVALSGGETPAATYRLLPQVVQDWSNVHLWLGDERCVPLDDPESNWNLVQRTLLAQPLEPPPHTHPVPGIDGDPEQAAAAYERELRTHLPDDPPRFDVALQGLGEDGHTASLFPEDPALEERERRVVAVHGAKPPFERVTITLPVLWAAHKVIMLAEGAGKAWAIGAMQAGPSPRVPASLLAEGTDVELIADHGSAPG